MKKTNKQKLRLACDKLWADIVKSSGRCLICSKTHDLHAHHIICRNKSSFLRYQLLNGACLCSGCHMRLHLSQDITIYKAILDYLGEAFDVLESFSREEVRLTVEYYESWKEILEKIYKKLK